MNTFNVYMKMDDGCKEFWTGIARDVNHAIRLAMNYADSLEGTVIDFDVEEKSA
jgi:hypothetical protein